MATANDKTLDGDPSRARSRAKRACKACNARRVRCNAIETQPCNNCKAANISCELMLSRRGKYTRHSDHSTQHSPSVDISARTKQQNGPGRLSEYHDSNLVDSIFVPHTESISLSKETNVNDDGSRNPQWANFPTTSPDRASSTREVATNSTVFIGESSSISAVHGVPTSSDTHHCSPTDKSNLRYPILDSIHTTSSLTSQDISRKAAKKKFLIEANAFDFPPSHICEVLLRAYFTWFHPCFPIIDRADFSNAYMSNTSSPLLLQAVLFIGASYCDDAIFQSIGLPDRQRTRTDHYHHAKDLYDADYETDKITVLQALFLMSFWRAGPLLDKNTFYWLGAALSLAQIKGMHRSSPNTSLSDKKLPKKIWWSLYIRDRQCSAAMGLPIRIRDEDCDIERLVTEDFEENDSVYPEFFGTQKPEHVLYFIHMTKLAGLLGSIVLCEFSPHNGVEDDADKAKLKDKLMQWESELPLEMRLIYAPESFWASTLHLSYNNLYILLYRSAYLKKLEDGGQGASQVAHRAACRNTRITEDMIAQGLCQYGNVHLITSIFNSMLIHTIHLRRCDGAARKLSEYRAQICILGLRELQKTWDGSNWVLQLFFQFLDKSTVQKLRLSENEEAVPTASKTNLTQAFQNIESNSTIAGISDAAPNSGENNQQLVAQPPGVVSSLDFASHFIGSGEAEGFSLFQVQPNLFQGDIFGSDLDQFYNDIFQLGRNVPSQPEL